MSTPKMTDKLLSELRDRAATFGLVLAGRCQYCLRSISSTRSLKDRAGPTCKNKHAKRNGSGIPAKKSPEAVAHTESNS